MNCDQHLISSITANGYAIVDNFLPSNIYHALKQYSISLEQKDEFDKAGIGKDNEHQIKSEIRGDWICWLSMHDEESVQYYFKMMDELRRLMNYSFFLSLAEVEAHFAVYPIGKFYLKHRDQFQGNDIRQISIVLFLNDSWNLADKGELCIYNEDTVKIIEPIANRLVCFRSILEHEVLPTYAKRYSLTGWLRKQEVPFVD